MGLDLDWIGLTWVFGERCLESSGNFEVSRVLFDFSNFVFIFFAGLGVGDWRARLSYHEHYCSRAEHRQAAGELMLPLRTRAHSPR